MFFFRRQQPGQPPQLSAVEAQSQESLQKALALAQAFNPADHDAPRHRVLHADNGQAVLQRNDRGVRYAGFTHLPIVDWDWPDPAHRAADAITIRHLGDVIESLHEDVRHNPHASYSLAMTPGGVHAFNLSESLKPTDFYTPSRTETLNADPYYVRISQEPKHVAGIQYPDGIFWSRVSPKLDREPEREFIQLPMVGHIGARPNPAALQQLQRYHHDQIASELAANPMRREAMMHSYNLLDRQLATVNAALRNLYGLQAA